MRDDAPRYFDGIARTRLPRWSNGRSVLLGDAAWATGPFGTVTSLALGSRRSTRAAGSCADSTVATATVSTNVFTLSALQGGENNTDKLQIIYDAITGGPTYDTPSLPNNAAKETGGNLATVATRTPARSCSNGE